MHKTAGYLMMAAVLLTPVYYVINAPPYCYGLSAWWWVVGMTLREVCDET